MIELIAAASFSGIPDWGRYNTPHEAQLTTMQIRAMQVNVVPPRMIPPPTTKKLEPYEITPPVVGCNRGAVCR